MRQAEALKKQKPSGAAIDPDPEAIDAYRNYRALKEQLYRLEQECNALEVDLQIKIGLNAGLTDIASWALRPHSSLDREAFDRDYPGIYERYQKTSYSRTFKPK